MFRRFAAGASSPVIRSSSSVLFALITVFAITAPAAADTLRGRVTDPAGQPVANARVVLLSGPSVVAAATTAADGTYGPIEAPSGRYAIVVVAPGLRLAPATVTLDGGNLRQDLSLELAAHQEAVVVSAAQVETTATRAASSVSVVTGFDAEAMQARDLTDVLTGVPGLSAASSGTAGALTALFPRGGESDYTLVLVDGVPQNAFGGAFDAGHLALTNIEQVEVVRGPQSALYGSGAIGGIVHVVSRTGGAPQASVSVEGGGYGTTATNASAVGSSGAWSFGGGFDWLSSEGDTRSFESIGGAVANDDYERVVATGSLAWSDGPDRRIRLNVRGGRNERGFPGPYGSDPAGLYSGLDTISRGTNNHASLAASADLRSGRLTHHLQGTWSNAWSDFASPFGASEDSTRRVTGRYQADTALGSTGISGGAEWLVERARSTFITGSDPASPLPVERSNVGLFVEARPELHRRLITSAGLRAERLERQRLPGSSSRPDFDASVIWSANPKLAVAWVAHEATGGSWMGTTTLRTSAGTGLKAPTAFDIAFTDNPGLKPERSRSLDVGIEQHLWHSRAFVDVTWFRNTYDDLIVTVTQPLSGVSRYETDNIANARSSGLEVAGGVRLTRTLDARATWTWLDTEVLGIDSLPGVGFDLYEVGDALVRRPRHTSSLDLRWLTGRANAVFTLHQRGSMRDLEPNWGSMVVTNPGRVTARIAGSFRLTPHLEIYGRVTNLFDRRYEDIYGFPAMGRSLIAGIRASAGR
jgi:outer membrane cobalamin receptor